MRSLSLGTVLLLASLGCEHTSKNNQPASEPTTGGGRAVAPSDHGGQPTTPPALPPTPRPDPTPIAAEPPSGDDLRPPVAADLAEYTKAISGTGKLVATLETNHGTLHCELYGDQAPMTVANFIGLATGQKPWRNPKTGTIEKGTPYFDGLTFHRVIPEFMIQGGDPLGAGHGGPGYQFGDEFTPDLTMKPGVLAMANAGPSTNGSQFFVTEVAPTHLNMKHTIFGQCKELDIVKAIARLPQNSGNKPNEPVTMKVSIAKMQSW